MKIKKNWGGVGSGGGISNKKIGRESGQVRGLGLMRTTNEVIVKIKKKSGIGGSGWGGQGGCERRIEVFVKIKKKNRGGGGSSWGVSVDVNEELK